MAVGRLKAVGSSFFLKKRFGSGYRLVCVKQAHCDSSKVTELLNSHISGIQIFNEIGTELTYALSESYAQVFQTLLRDLETNSKSLGIDSFGISMTTLEEIFLK